jgi:hypothetical protein
LKLDAQGQTNTGVDGIYNANSEELSFVQHVSMINIANTKSGLYLSSVPAPAPPARNNGTSSHSGPYSDISVTVLGTTSKCVNIFGATGSQGYVIPEPRGIHGLTCAGTSNTGAAIYLDGNNVSIDDAYITGFADGVLVGSQGTAASNILLNIRGASNVTRLIHICGKTLSGNCPQNSTANASDLTIMGATSAANTTIQDDLVNGMSTINDRNVGMYVLGKPVLAGTSAVGYSRLTTSPSVPSWIIGTGQLTPCSAGSLYSKTSGSGTTLYECIGSGGWTAVQ